MKIQLLVLSALFSFLIPIQSTYAQANTKEKPSTATGIVKHKPGESYGGGKIFWVDETGQHGLIAANSDQSAEGIAWNPATSVATSATADGVYSGESNSGIIVKAQGTTTNYAARLCQDLSLTVDHITYTDWYLPSKKELQLLYQQKQAVGGFNTTSGIYWSSTESMASPQTMAWELEFKYGSQYEDDKDLPNQVRCIRKF
jgi:hypothetical protein